LELARVLLCSADAGDRPCLECRHCRRLQENPDHPDFHVLERDLKASTSIGATRGFFKGVLLAPYEAEVQVYVVAEAESLRPEAADTLLKILEEPPGSTPRYFFLLSASRASLLPTVRSRCLSFYLGPSQSLEEERVQGLAQELRECLVQFQETGSPSYLLAAAAVLEKGGAWDDPRNRRPWDEGAAALLACAREPLWKRSTMLSLLALAQDLQVAHRWRERGLRPARILEGLVFRHLA
jgi:DNA polymerase-3 subunit delta'